MEGTKWVYYIRIYEKEREREREKEKEKERETNTPFAFKEEENHLHESVSILGVEFFTNLTFTNHVREDTK